MERKLLIIWSGRPQKQPAFARRTRVNVIALNFDTYDRLGGGGTDFKLAPSDKLRDVQIKKIGTCI